jgi:hypothetical protein
MRAGISLRARRPPELHIAIRAYKSAHHVSREEERTDDSAVRG